MQLCLITFTQKDIKFHDVAFKSKPIDIDNAKVKPKARSQQYKTFWKYSNPILHKTTHLSSTKSSSISAASSTASTHQAIATPSTCSPWKSIDMQQRELLKAKHQAQQMENQNEVSQTSHQNQTARGKKFYKETLIAQKKNKVIFQIE